MRKLYFLIMLFPTILSAQPLFGFDHPDSPPHHHRPPLDPENHLPEFLFGIDLTAQQQNEIKSLLKANRCEFETKLDEARKIETEIKQISRSSDYRTDKIQELSNKTAALHKDLLIMKTTMDNKIYKLLNDDQKQKLASNAADKNFDFKAECTTKGLL